MFIAISDQKVPFYGIVQIDGKKRKKFSNKGQKLIFEGESLYLVEKIETKIAIQSQLAYLFVSHEIIF
jgi:hypothetical protein